MKTFKHIRWTGKRHYECTNLVACVGDSAPNDNWVECDRDTLPKFLTEEEHMRCVPGMMRLSIVSGVEYWGYL